ncbi:GNAT family N-acetyltransferase [Paraconexibacter sp.]|uniref:GNAT family N-acetyltransferase n=1 Tax=Paraconexibacter sp. TaxID=2949640 RepID=UPI00356358FF
MPELRHPDRPLAAADILLRPWARAELEEIHQGMQDPEVPRWTGIPAAIPLHEVRRRFDAQPRAARDGEELMFAIADRDTDRFLGAVSLLRIDWPNARVEVGYWLAPWGRGRGAASTAVTLLTDWAVATHGFVRVELRIDARNGASAAVARRCGFTYEGTLRSFEWHGDERIDLAVFARVGDEHPSPG